MAALKADGIKLAGRSGWQLLVSYGVGSWLVLQVAETLGSLVGLPLWFGRSLLAVLLVGLLLLILSLVVQAGRVALPATAKGDRRGARGWLTTRNVALAAVLGVAGLGLATAGYLGLRAAGIGPAGTLMSRGVLDDQERLILANIEGPDEDADLGRAVTTLFRIDLAQSPSFAVLEPIQLTSVLGRMRRDPAQALTTEVAVEAARREGVKAVLAGELLSVGDAFVVAVRLVSASSGEVLAAVRETARSAADLPRAVDRASARMRERIGESLRTIRGDPPLQQVTTRSFSALEKYALAEAANNVGAASRAIDLLGEAIAEDSTFAMAHRKLAIILRNEGRDDARADRAFARAWALRDHLSDRERWLAEAAYRGYVANDQPGAAAIYRTVLERYPADGIALNNLAGNHASAGRPEDALVLYRRSIELGSGLSVTYMNAVETHFALGQTDSAKRMLKRFRDAYSGNPQADGLASRLASAQFDYDSAEYHARRFMAVDPTDPALQIGGLAGLSQIMLVQGRLDEARRAMREATELDQRFGVGMIGMTPDQSLARMDAEVAFWYFGDIASAVAEVDRVFTMAWIDSLPVDDRPYSELVSFNAQAGRIPEARAWLSRYESALPSDRRESTYAWHIAVAELALSEARFSDALNGFNAARAMVADCSICFLIGIGRTFEAAGQPDSAIVTYTRYLETPHISRIDSDALGLAPVLLRLAELHERAGQPGTAIRYYSKLLDLWATADPRFQGPIESIRQSITRLTSAIG